jgi:hypothetical protein
MHRRRALIAAVAAMLMTLAPLAGSAQAAKLDAARTEVPTGRYLIVSENPEAGHLDFAPFAIRIYPPIYFIVGSHNKDLKEQWTVTPTGDGTYTIDSTTHPRASWALRGSAIVASEGQKDEFSIEPAGGGSYRIHVPNEDAVATLHTAGAELLHTEPDTGSDAQRWNFVPIDQ